MLTQRYMVTTKNLPKILEQIVKGTAPAKFNVEHLKGLGFSSSNDRAVIPLLKDLKLLSDDGTPTARYHQYRGNPKAVLGEALKEAYEELFHVNAKPSDSDRAAIQGKFKTAHGVSDAVAERQALTFLSLMKQADISAPAKVVPSVIPEERPSASDERARSANAPLSLRYNIEIHLPPTKDIEVYRAIFKAVREHLAE